jgi:hypothetical protein
MMEYLSSLLPTASTKVSVTCGNDRKQWWQCYYRIWLPI